MRRDQKPNVSEHPQNRQKILELIGSSPGIHKSEICRKLGSSWGTTTHHIGVLAGRDLIYGTRIGTRIHFTSYDPIPERRIQSALMMPHSREILRLFKANRVLGPTQVCTKLGLGRKVVRSHVVALLQDGLLDSDGGYHPRFWLPPN